MKRCLLAELSWRTRRQHSQELRQGLESPRAHPCMITAAASKKKKKGMTKKGLSPSPERVVAWAGTWALDPSPCSQSKAQLPWSWAAALQASLLCN